MDDRDAQARIDAALVERAVRDGDPRVFEILVRRHQGAVRAQLRRLLDHDPGLADDLAQDTFVLAWRKLQQFRGDSRFGTWLHCIAHSCFLQQVRRKGEKAPEPAAPDTDDHVDHGVGTAASELGLDLEGALQQLSTDQRAALLYCVQLGLSHEEAAQVLDMPLGTVKTHIARGKARLRVLLADWATGNTSEDLA